MLPEREKKAVVAVMDSGVGGLPYLESARALLPRISFAYLADREGFPYGTKSREEVEAIVKDRVTRLVAAFEPIAVVIACNTASQAGLAAVRAEHPGLPIIGTVPAVKPAAERTRSGTIGVLATAAAVQDPYLDELERSFAAGRTVVRRGAQDLVSFVERRYLEAGADETRAILRPHLEYLMSRGADEIVLACTHFLHFAREIGDFAAEIAAEKGQEAPRVIDSREGVARRLRDLLDRGRFVPPSVGSEGSGLEGDGFYLTGPEPFEAVYSSFAARYGLAGPFALAPSGP